MSQLIDLTGNKYGKLTVLKKDEERKTKSGSYWICQCECGNVKSVKSSSLRRGEIQSCGCLRKEAAQKAREKRIIDLTGQRFGYLTVLERDDEEQKKHSGAVYWKCICDCGTIKSIRGSNLTKKDENRTISCGCFHRSLGETEIYNLLEQNKINFIEQYRFPDFSKKSYDFAIINEQSQIIRLIEFDGEQHYKESFSLSWESLETIQKRDVEKNQYAKDHNIPLVRIPYWERDKITLDMIMGDQYLVI